MPKPTHRETCRALASLLLSEPWADSVCWEVGIDGSQFDVLAVTGHASVDRQMKRTQLWEQRVNWQRKRGHPEDPSPRSPVPRIAVGEVKMSREDLLAGIHRGQFRKYQEHPVRGSHFLLAVWEEALVRANPMIGYWRPEDTQAALADLSSIGIPGCWGVVRVHLHLGRKEELGLDVIRRAERQNDGGPLLHRLGLAEKMGRSLAYRILSPSSPEQE